MAAQSKLFQRLIWLVDTIYSAGHISRDEIDRRWSSARYNDMHETEYGERNFHRHRETIQEMFGVDRRITEAERIKVKMSAYDANYMRTLPIHNIVVFANATKFDIFHEEGEVIYINELIPTIMRLRSAEPFYTQEQIQIKANLLLEKNITAPELRKQHNQAANAAKYERRAKIESGICPRCGGQLVIREGKYGQFYGCSNYPKCDFNVKSLRTDYEDINDKRRLGRRFYRRKRYW